MMPSAQWNLPMSEPMPESIPNQTAEAAPNRNLKRVGIGVAAVAMIIVVAGIATRGSATRELQEEADANAVPTVSVVTPTREADGSDLVLPGNVQAFNSAPIFARTNGYVSCWLADIGDRVNAGQVLAILDAPELDQQLAQANADYQTALANQTLAKTTAARWSGMLQQDAVSRQETDEKTGDFAAKSAIANAELANVKRLRALQGFTRLSAPFAGVVTSRSAQIGALVVSGTAAAQPLFTVSDVHRMRVYVRVPQGYSAQVHPGLQAFMTMPEFPGRKFPVTLVRSANAVDVQSGTVLIELQADNHDGTLKPGAYAQVNFPISGTVGSVRLPTSAVIFGAEGPQVAIVDEKGQVALKSVTVGHDEGKQIEITSGLSGRERVIDTPPDSVGSGDQVHAIKVPPVTPATGGVPNAKG
jgi:RND family efflux transporter MFP subunit